MFCFHKERHIRSSPRCQMCWHDLLVGFLERQCLESRWFTPSVFFLRLDIMGFRATRLNLTSGWYLNNCICSEQAVSDSLQLVKAWGVALQQCKNQTAARMQHGCWILHAFCMSRLFWRDSSYNRLLISIT